jgi:hypothetical protein
MGCSFTGGAGLAATLATGAGTETGFSSTGGAGLVATGVLAGTGVPQLVQKRVLDDSLAPQPVQKAVTAGAAAAIGLPQVVQNFEEALTSLPHDEQTAILKLLQPGFRTTPKNSSTERCPFMGYKTARAQTICCAHSTSS